MAFVVIRHKIKDYDGWRKVFDEAQAFRKENGEKSYRIFKDADDPNQLVGFFEWENMEKLKAFFNNPELKKKMQESGLTDEPNIYFLEEA